MLKKEHARTTKLGKRVKEIRVRPDDQDVRELLLEIAEKNPDKKTRAYAYRALVKQSEQAEQFVKRMKKDEELKEKVEKEAGKDGLKAINDIADKSGEGAQGLSGQARWRPQGAAARPVGRQGGPGSRSARTSTGKKVKLSDLRARSSSSTSGRPGAGRAAR